jgi:uncharacterized protein (DUF2126 family)/transglutaminase-like putative cysteine protease
MSIRVALKHTTSYLYDRPVTFEPHVVRLRPAPHCRTPILAYSMRIEPASHFLNWQQDPYSNYLARAVFEKPASELIVEVELVAEMTAVNPFDFFIEPAAESYPFPYDPTLARELVPYLEVAPAGPRLLALVDELRRPDARSLDFVVAANRRVQQLVGYLIRMEPGVQAPEETLALGSGSCRDSAWLLVQLFRRLGIAARFVSGYLIQLTADVKSLDGPSGPEQDFTDLHAWAEVYLPGAGWVGFDPTSGLAATEGHIPLACAADPTSAAPITGTFAYSKTADGDSCQEDFSHHMSVQRVHELPRVTKPYTEEQWRAIDALGERVDRDLSDGDVRLTMGGEPTFVSIDDRDAPEWNISALGPAKQRQADHLLRRLRARFAPGGLLHHGQGKWYPGEPLPRWCYGCYWRRDGIPLWEDVDLFARMDVRYGHGADEAGRFLHRLASRLGVDPRHCQPSYEDVWYLLWRERRLPTNVNPLDSKLDDPLERERLARLFDQGIGQVVGHALPLRRRHGPGAAAWESGSLFLRREHLFLLPGDSPMGYRLPLESLPWEPPEVRDQGEPLDPFAPRGPLPPRPPRIQADPRDAIDGAAGRNGEAGPGGTGRDGFVPGGVVRSVLCVEPRDGRLHVFLPPVQYAEDFIDLAAAIESVAAELGLPVLLEGYKPPHDHRLNHFQLTPDPGVLEVNLHPSAGWRDLVETTTTLYDEARAVRLSTEKFMLDGRHTGTGGGNHIVIGGPTAADSPVLRRPDLLRSLLGFWNNHPSLSYLFSSLFIGPTSQAPRVDEARHDSLHELELAFEQIPERGGCPPWLVDRVFRHLLVDVTGNTHRAEFCIDKLFSPDTSDDRRGLVELRAFEMPPHARMSLVQHLLLRAVIARFWKEPHRRPLVRWGAELHDRFMLPHFVEQDFNDLLLELRQGGYPLEPAWFAPHVEFRFPLLGAVTYQNVHVELRQAIEPWHVLGEEPAGGAAARYVDSSVERVQVKVRGLTHPRHVVACNGRRVPLHPTGTNGEFVAGVRYRAWQPPSCLHPTIPVHAPLVLDLFDTWTGTSMGGCQYHVSHPGGRSHEIFPVNASEAESRRKARFFTFGHTPGLAAVAETVTRPEAPLTLDLRQPTAASSQDSFLTPRRRSDKLSVWWNWDAPPPVEELQPR